MAAHDPGVTTAPADLVGPGLGALRATRQWLMVLLVTVVTLAGAIAALSVWPALSGVEHALVALTVVATPIAVRLSGRTSRLWALPLAVLPLTLAAVLVPTGSPPWVPMPNAASYPTLLLILLTGRWTGLAIAVAGPAGLAGIWSLRPTNVVAGPLPLFGGWAAVLQMLATTLAVWWAWNTLVREARAADAEYALQERNAARAVVLQERAATWRQAATRVHESVLNTIRYVLSAGDPDRGRLALEIADDVVATRSPGRAAAPTVPELVGAVLAESPSQVRVEVLAEPPAVGLDPDVFDAVRAASVELTRNSLRHGGASRVMLTATVDAEGSLVVTVTDNGTGLESGSIPGIGLGTVAAASLAAVGGHCRLETASDGGVEAVVVVPRVRAVEAGPPVPGTPSPLLQGRLLVTAALAGACAVGIVYFVRLALIGSATDRWAALLGIVGSVTAVLLVVRRRRIPGVAGLLLILAPAAVPWLLLGEAYPCGSVPGISAVLGISGFAAVTLAAWSGAVPAVVGGTVWALGGLLLVLSFPATCRESVSLALLHSVVVMPVLLSVSSAGATAYRRARRRTETSRQHEITEQSRAEAAVDINRQLNQAVTAALSLLRDVAAGAPLDDGMRRRLEIADGRIRAAIQVDPKASGGFARLAMSLVDDAAAHGIPVNVRALGSSSDPRPLPAPVRRLLTGALRTAGRRTPVLQVFTDGHDDHLALSVEVAAVSAAGLVLGSTASFDDVTIEVEDEPDEASAGVSLLVSRGIAAPAAGAGTSRSDTMLEAVR